MAGKLGKFQTSMMYGWKSDITKLNHISTLFGAAPQKASDVFIQVYAKNYGKTLESLLSKFPTKMFDTDDEYTWDLIGSSRRNIPLLYAVKEDGISEVTAGTDIIGANFAPFYLVFAEDAFFDGEVLHGNYNQVYPLRILGDGIKEGVNTKYKVELINGSAKGMPAERLLAGEKFSAEYAPVERELSRKVGGIRHSTPATMRNEWSTIRLFDKVSGALLDRKIKMGIPMVKEDASGKQVRGTAELWMHYEEYAFEKQWQEYKNNILAYGVSNRNANGEYMNFGKSGEVIRLGDGLYAQTERGNVYYYNHFSLKLLEEALVALCAGKMDFRDRTFLLKTGEFGALQFSKAASDRLSGWTQFTYNGDAVGVVRKTSSELSSNALAAGFQFVEWLAPNNIRLRVEVDPYYDDPVHNKIMHPNGGVAMSYRYDIFDFGSTEQQNIFKCAVKGKPESHGYMWGMRNPFTGQMNNQNMSYDEDSASWHRMATLGICVLDPTRTVSFIPALLQA